MGNKLVLHFVLLMFIYILRYEYYLFINYNRFYLFNNRFSILSNIY